MGLTTDNDTLPTSEAKGNKTQRHRQVGRYKQFVLTRRDHRRNCFHTTAGVIFVVLRGSEGGGDGVCDDVSGGKL